MTNTISFTVPGIPSGKPRPRRVRTRGGSGFHTYTPRAKNQGSLEYAILQARPKKPIEGPVRLTMTIFFSTRKPKPDIDNIVKLVMDCCQGEIYKDDKQVEEVSMKRVWTPGDIRMEVTIETLMAESPTATSSTPADESHPG